MKKINDLTYNTKETRIKLAEGELDTNTAAFIANITLIDLVYDFNRDYTLKLNLILISLQLLALIIALILNIFFDIAALRYSSYITVGILFIVLINNLISNKAMTIAKDRKNLISDIIHFLAKERKN